MPYKKGGAAEQRAKVRRTAKRRIARLEKEIARSDDAHQRDLFRRQIDNLRDAISRTYERNPLTHKATGFERDELRLAVQTLRRVNEASLIGTSSRQRRNFLTQQELNIATPYDQQPDRPTRYTREEVSIFYAATREAWQNLPSTANRNKAILEYYGRESLSEFVDEVLELNKKLIVKAQRFSELVESSEGLTPEEIQQATEGSAIWAAELVRPDSYDSSTSDVQRP